MAELSKRVSDSLAIQEQYLHQHAAVLARAGISLGVALARGNKLVTVGCPVVARHLVAEVVGRYGSERPGLPAISLCENVATMTAVMHDYGRDRIYARALAALAQPGDFVLVFMAGVDAATRSAVDQAQKLGLETLVLEVPGAEESAAMETFLTAAHLLYDAAEAELQRILPELYPENPATDALTRIPSR